MATQNQGRFLVITDSAGQIVATCAAPADANQPKDETLIAGIAPLPGQSLHLIEMPEEFLRLKTAQEKHEWLSHREIEVAPTPRIRVRHYPAASKTDKRNKQAG